MLIFYSALAIFGLEHFGHRDHNGVRLWRLCTNNKDSNHGLISLVRDFERVMAIFDTLQVESPFGIRLRLLHLASAVVAQFEKDFVQRCILLSRANGSRHLGYVERLPKLHDHALGVQLGETTVRSRLEPMLGQAADRKKENG
jgi:hypothetical protein